MVNCMVNKILNFFFQNIQSTQSTQSTPLTVFSKRTKVRWHKGSLLFNPLILGEEDFVRIKHVQFLKYFIQL
jgi:hypothetical protein